MEITKWKNWVGSEIVLDSFSNYYTLGALSSSMIFFFFEVLQCNLLKRKKKYSSYIPQKGQRVQ